MVWLLVGWSLAVEYCGSYVTADQYEYSGCQFEHTKQVDGTAFVCKTELTITDCSFIGYWYAKGPYGGIVKFDTGDAVATVTGSKFKECHGYYSCCFWFTTGASGVFTSCSFEKCISDHSKSNTAFPKEQFVTDWGRSCVVASTYGDVRFSQCNFTENTDGGLTCLSNGKIVLDGCVFTDNFVDTPGCPGGDIFVGLTGYLNATACEFTNDKAVQGRSLCSSGGTIYLKDCDFSSKSTEGSTIYFADQASVTIEGGTFSGPCMHIDAASKISIELIGCVEFIDAEEEAAIQTQSVSFTGEGSASFVGKPCPVPTTEPPTDDPEGGGGEPEPGASDSDPVVPGKPSDDDDDDEDDDDDDDDSKNDKNKLNGGEIAAIVIVVLIVIAAIVAVLLFFLVFRRRYGSKSSASGEEATSEVTTTEEVVTGTGAVNQQYGGDFGLWDSEAPESDQGSKEQ